MSGFKQIDLFESVSSNIDKNLYRCWRCGDYFPLSRLLFFDCRYPDGNVGIYQACNKCYDVIALNGGCVDVG